MPGAKAQSTTPRFGISKNQDNTGRVLTYGYATYTDTTGADSIAIRPVYFEQIYNITLKDSLTIKNPTTTQSYYGDIMKLCITAPSGTPFLKFTGAAWKTQGTLTLTTNRKAFVTFTFDGTTWVESGRLNY